MTKYRIITSALVLSLTLAAFAEEEVTTVTIVDHITAGTDNIIEQPEQLLQRLLPIASPEGEETAKEEVSRPVSGRMAGYRVQVFSDNNSRTAKNEAKSKQRTIAQRFPQYQTYVMYTSPYWRLKVGDFRSQHEANSAAAELRRAFPAYSKEIRVVRDRVNISGD